MCLNKSFNVVAHDLYLADFVTLGDTCMLYDAPRIELIILRKMLNVK